MISHTVFSFLTSYIKYTVSGQTGILASNYSERMWPRLQSLAKGQWFQSV